MIKYIGMIFIAISCTTGGFIFSDNIKLRIIQIQKFIEFGEYIIKRIEIYKYPAEKIFAQYYTQNKDENLNIFLESLNKNGRINTINGDIYKNPWEFSLNQCADFLYIKSEELNIIQDFGAKIGTGRTEEQVFSMRENLEKLRQLYETEHQRSEDLAKLYRLSGGLIGAFICILFI